MFADFFRLFHIYPTFNHFDTRSVWVKSMIFFWILFTNNRQFFLRERAKTVSIQSKNLSLTNVANICLLSFIDIFFTLRVTLLLHKLLTVLTSKSLVHTRLDDDFFLSISKVLTKDNVLQRKIRADHQIKSGNSDTFMSFFFKRS